MAILITVKGTPMLDKQSSKEQLSGLRVCDQIKSFWFKPHWALDWVELPNFFDFEAANVTDYIQK